VFEGRVVDVALFEVDSVSYYLKVLLERFSFVKEEVQ
jgi:hypothetical protein